MCRKCRAYLRALETCSFEAALLFFEALPHTPRFEPLLRPFQDYSLEHRSGPGTRLLQAFSSEGLLGPWRVIHEGRTVLMGLDADTFFACLVSPSYTPRDEQMIAELFGRDASVMLRYQQEQVLVPVES
jgi:hypothetical protein